MPKMIESQEVPLKSLLEDAQKGALQLPDFQRDWIWDQDRIISLLASISRQFPIGALMTLGTGGDEVSFKHRVLEGVTVPSAEPSMLLLDGQQRMTSLYQSLIGTDPVQTRDRRGHKIKRYFYADIEACVDRNGDLEEDGIVALPPDRRLKSNFGRTIDLDVSTRELEYQHSHFPLSGIFDFAQFQEWQLGYFQYCQDSARSHDSWMLFHQRFINSIMEYQVPVIRLDRSTPREAVCQVFEKVNTGGVTLSVFELVTASFAAHEFDLRDDWQQIKRELENNELLSNFDETSFLQIVSLLVTHDAHTRHRNQSGSVSGAPAVACKRRDLLKLSLGEYKDWRNRALTGLKAASEFLRSECFFRNRDLPYRTQVVPLAAILAVVGNAVTSAVLRQRLQYWLWCGILGEMYGGSVETRFANDVVECVAWLRDSGPEPRTVADAQFQDERLHSLRTRNSAAYKGLFALQMKRGAIDLKTGLRLEHDVIFDHSVDIHHIFPRAWCESEGVEAKRYNSAINKTALSSATNRHIGGTAPSIYLDKLVERGHVEDADLEEAILSHDIDPDILKLDDFDNFYVDRFERLIEQIESVMGKPVNRSETLEV